MVAKAEAGIAISRSPCSLVCRPRNRSMAQPPATYHGTVTPPSSRAMSAGRHGSQGGSRTSVPPGGIAASVTSPAYHGRQALPGQGPETRLEVAERGRLDLGLLGLVVPAADPDRRRCVRVRLEGGEFRPLHRPPPHPPPVGRRR